jgi:hypothetical protein
LSISEPPGGCDFPVDPDLDAQVVQPIWQPDPDALVQLSAYSGDADCAPFRIADIPGRKVVTRDGARRLLTVFIGNDVLRMALNAPLKEGGAAAYIIPFGPRAVLHWRAVARQIAVIDRAISGRPATPARRPTRDALVEMHTLQALDGKLVGASTREIACAIFGARRVREQYHPDSDLRGKVRAWVQRGRDRMQGGYRALLREPGRNHDARTRASRST